MRSLWKGAISFGLINIPVSLYTATREQELKFHLLHKKDLSPIRYARVCIKEEKEVPYQDVVKGYEENGQFVVMSDEDFEKAAPQKSHTIEILEFTDENSIDSIYFEKPYYLKAEKQGEKAYALLLEALKQSAKVAIAKYVFKNHEHIAAIIPYKNILVLNQMRFQDQLIAPSEIEMPAVKMENKEIEMAIKLIEQLTGKFQPKRYHDAYTKELEEVIRKKGKGIKVAPKGKEPKPSKVYDIMSLLKASLEKKGKQENHKTKAKGEPKRKAKAK